MMRVTVSNNIRVQSPSHVIRRWAEENLILPNPEYASKARMGFWIGDTPEWVVLYAEDGGDLVLPYGCISDVWRLHPRKEDWETRYAPFCPVRLVSGAGKVNPREYQQNAVEALLDASRGILEAPCGSGKTQMGLMLAQKVGGRTLWLTHTHELLTQSAERAKSMFESPRIGITTAGKAQFGEDITFATVQTFSRLEPSLYKDAFSCVIVDECHHCVGSPTQARMFWKVVNAINCRFKYGLTATPKRADGLTKEMYLALGPLAYRVAREDVAKYTMKAERLEVRLNSGLRPGQYLSSDGMLDFTALINALCACESRNAAICGEALRLKEAYGLKRQLLLTARVPHALELTKLLKGKGLDAGAVIGDISAKKRDFSHEITVATYALAKEGLDFPDLEAVHLCTPIKDEATVKQCAGRVERRCEGKARCYVVDYVDGDIPYCVNCGLRRKRILKRN